MNACVTKERLAEIVDHVSDAVIIIDTNRVICFANRAAVKMGGAQNVAEVVGTNYDDILRASRILDEKGRVASPESFPSTRALREGVETRDVMYEQIYDGKHMWLSVSSFPLCGSDGTVEYAAVFFRDRSLRKSRIDKLNFLLQSNKILSLTADANERLVEKARLMVPSLADWCTLNLVEDDGTISRIAIVHRDPAKVPLVEELADLSLQELGESTGLRKVIATGVAQFYPTLEDTQFSQADSNDRRNVLARELQVSSSLILPIFSRDKVVGALSLAYAGSGRTYTREDMEFMEEFCHHIGILVDNARLYEEIQRGDRAKDTFIAMLSHELRNPLAPIKSSLELLKMSAKDPEVGEQLGIIEHQFNHLTKLLNDLLDVTRYSNGKIYLEPAAVDVREILGNVVNTSRSFLEQKHIELMVELPQEPLWLWADQTRLEQALMNIIHNAEKFTPEHGHIWVSARQVGDSAVISVRDDGIGIPKDALPHIFNLHGSDEQALRRSKNGLGLGLVLVNNIVHLHGGSVEARSEGEGQGAEFILILPLAQ